MMDKMFNKPKKIRKHNRLPGYDYSQNGYYFITVCTQGRIEWFAEVGNDKIILNGYGEILQKCWHDLPIHYKNIKLDEFVIMPNHIHVIIIIDNGNVGNGLKPFPTNHGLSEIVRGLKTFSSRKINETINDGVNFRWQKSFYDHVIRDEISLNRIREYIRNNPALWDDDIENKGNYSGGVDYYEKLFCYNKSRGISVVNGLKPFPTKDFC
jgi:REP element-mobilizing transposase RayT